MFKRVYPKVKFFKSFGKSPSRIFGTSGISGSPIFQQTYRYARTQAFLKKLFYLIFTALFSSKKGRKKCFLFKRLPFCYFSKSLCPHLSNVIAIKDIFLFQETGMAKSCHKVDCDVSAEVRSRTLQGSDFEITITST